MSAAQRIHRQQLVIREAEGYLDLAMVFGDQWPLPDAVRHKLAQRSLAAVERLGKSADDSPQLQLIRGQALRTLDRYKEALAPLAVAAEGEPNNVETWLALGWCHKRTGRLDLAIESLEEALEAEPGSAIVHYNLACYWSLARNKRQAIAYLSQALMLDSAFRDQVDGEADFNPIRQDPDFQAITSVVV